MGWLFVFAGVIASLFFYGLDQYILLIIAIVATVGTFWGYGVMHNFAINSASRRPGFRGGFSEIDERDADAAPDSITRINLAFSLTSLGLMVAAIAMVLLQ